MPEKIPTTRDEVLERGFGPVVAELSAPGLSAASHAAYDRDLRTIVGALPDNVDFTSLTAEDITAVYNNARISPGIATRLGVAIRIIDRLKDGGGEIAAVIPKLEKVDSYTRSPLTPDQVECLYTYTAQREVAHYMATIALALQTGAKSEVLLGLGRNDVALGKDNIVVDFHYQRHSDPYEHRITGRGVDIIKRYAKEDKKLHPKHKKFLSGSGPRSGDGLTKSAVSLFMREAARQLDIPGLALQDFRLTYIQNFQGTDEELARALNVGIVRAQMMRECLIK